MAKRPIHYVEDAIFAGLAQLWSLIKAQYSNFQYWRFGRKTT